MDKKINSIQDVVEGQLCTGCGLCAAVETTKFSMTDVPNLGRRPISNSPDFPETGQALAMCPGANLPAPQVSPGDQVDEALLPEWGPVLEVWEGYAADPEIRLKGSSGGAATALSLWALEKQNLAGVVHTAIDEDNPLRNKTVYSQDREALIKTTGSRYSPASPCDGISFAEGKPIPSVFVGKPCDVAAIHNYRKNTPGVFDLTIACFCAGTPSYDGLTALLKSVGISDPKTVKSLKFRGDGWPGYWEVQYEDSSGSLAEEKLTYADSWAFLQKYRQWRCYICPDHTGEFADIAVGDPWHTDKKDNESGLSLIVARTAKGLQSIRQAEADGYIVLGRNNSFYLPDSQPGLQEVRRTLWGRLLALKLTNAFTPSYPGYGLYRVWMQNLGAADKLRSILSTLKRVKTKKLRKRVTID